MGGGVGLGERGGEQLCPEATAPRGPPPPVGLALAVE